MNTTYFTFLREVLTMLPVNIALLFQGKGDINHDFVVFHQIFLSYSGGFGVGGWIFYILMMLLAGSIVVSAIAIAIYWIRKNTLRHKQGVEFSKLSEENERLHVELFGLRRALLKSPVREAITFEGGYPALLPKKDAPELRFPRLCQIDESASRLLSQQNENKTEITKNLSEICENFRNYAASQLKLYYSRQTIRSFMAALASSKLIVLEGISGVGKTSFPCALGKFMQTEASVCPVQPSWRDHSELFGYYNEFARKFNETDFLCALYQSHYQRTPQFIILDEMNIARVEYYFADMLSLLELPNLESREITLVSSSDENDPALIKQGKIQISPNTFFIGTANNDESTFAIADKVYDRAISIPFEKNENAFIAPACGTMDLPYEQLQSLFDRAKQQSPATLENKGKFFSLIDYFHSLTGIHVGNRFAKQLEDFVPCYVACGGKEEEALDFLFRTKLLHRLSQKQRKMSPNMVNRILEKIVNLFGNDAFMISRSYLMKTTEGLQ